ncbi:hypothetical protein NH26_23685 [Flammeovirga pacifica]|uniref:Uncharacterized protein n=1 Tax=Flammeovirga pacifica TaxID=915059 RepID=A0A1S1YU68_FLAPC|nr:hypothetical protein NH26_23685 [Flammeovirga pacifica]
MKVFKKYFVTLIIIIIYVFLYGYSISILMNYEDHFSQGKWYSFESFESHELKAFIIYKYLLNFPLSFFVWFSDELLFLTTFLFIPNAICISILFNKLIFKKR